MSKGHPIQDVEIILYCLSRDAPKLLVIHINFYERYPYNNIQQYLNFGWSQMEVIFLIVTYRATPKYVM